MNMYNGQQSIFDEINQKADIVSIIGSYIKLEHKGANYVGICPFHQDTSPSLSVSPQKKV
jgi:DNA primase